MLYLVFLFSNKNFLKHENIKTKNSWNDYHLIIFLTNKVLKFKRKSTEIAYIFYL